MSILFRKQTYVANSSSDSKDTEDYYSYSVERKRKRRKKIEADRDEEVNRTDQQEDERQVRFAKEFLIL